MKEIITDIPVIISRVNDHENIKPVVLKYIDEIPNSSIRPDQNTSDNISKTDWNLPKDTEKKYLDFVKPILVDTLTESFRKYKITGLAFTNFWFQQYYKSDLHDWHVHSSCHFSSVYFLELPYPNEMKTELLKIGNKELIEYDIREGDIITFPSMLYHRSPPNHTGKRKSIISFNLNFISHYEELDV